MDDSEDRSRVDDVAGKAFHLAGERWMLEGEIARGGMGRVELVYDRHLQRRLARKCLIDDRDSQTSGFIREARITGRLEHPNIPPIHEVGVGRNGVPFFTMKHVHGHDLAALTYDVSRALYDPGRLHDLLEVFRRVCDAVAFAHQNGVLHRDLKLDNVRVGSLGQVYLMDWGIAKVFDRKRFEALGPEPVDPEVLADAPDGIRLGTPRYMSPEQVRGQNSQLDERADVWALGVMLYEILTRRLPFDGESNDDIFTAIIRGPLIPPSRAARGSYVPELLEAVVLKALQPSPDDRFRDALDLRDAVDQFLRGSFEFPSREFEAGEIIVRSGDIGREAYVIVNGLCSVWAETRTGEVFLNHMRAGDVFGEAAVLSESRRAATVKAEEPTTVYVVSKELIDAELQGQKPWIAVTIRTLAERFRQNASRLKQLLEPPTARDVARHVLMYARTFGLTEGDTLKASWSRTVHECMIRFDIQEADVEAAFAGKENVEIDRGRDLLVLSEWPTMAGPLKRP